ncbi:hypothetical protein EVA_12223 [gut metagenome]|uniref:Uncharacterized protein n=1 Tax=gut metagenome TaxID=749906 RepID=J9CHZ6_9ZZZZ
MQSLQIHLFLGQLELLDFPFPLIFLLLFALFLLSLLTFYPISPLFLDC